jgi:hypothetical protein
MKAQSIIVILLMFGNWGCNRQKDDSLTNSSFEKHIRFNHLFVVIDDSTYKYMLDSLNFLNDFSRNREDTVDTGDESWSGKYLFGKNNYLEIFGTSGYEGAKLGDVGLGFMSNKLGTLDSLYRDWSISLDSVILTNRDFIDEHGEARPWLRTISIPNKDSLQIEPWLIENTKEEMIDAGFTENDLLNVIEFSDYSRYRRAKRLGISPDSAKYDKLFDKVTSIYLTLSDKELSYLRQYLIDFGFIEKNKAFSTNDFEVNFLVSESRHFILNQIDFALSDTLPKQKHTFKNLELLVEGNKASLKIKYD